MRTVTLLLLASTALASDAAEGLQRGKCEKAPTGAVVAGADSYFVGKLAVTDAGATGTETWVLFANEKWKSGEGADCEIEWKLEATRSDAIGSCVDCDYALAITATPQRASESCPDALVDGEKSAATGQVVGGESKPWSETYAVKVEGEQAWLYYAKSGRKVATGAFKDGELSYVTNHQCKWF